MQLLTRFKKLTFALMGVLALGVVVSLNQATLAQRPITGPTVAERQGPEVAPPKRDFGDMSIAFRNLARQALPSIVSVDAMSWPTRACQGPMSRHTLGSGFVVDPAGRILTSSQLVFGADRVRVRLRDGSEFMANSVRMDPRSNVAVLQISPIANLPALPLGNSDTMQVGDWVMALGRDSRLNPTSTTGTINSVVPGPGVSRGEDFFQTSAALNPGTGGGPLLNLNGQVVGINTSASHFDEELDRTGFAVPSNLVGWSSQQLMNNGVVNRGMLGVTTQPMSPSLARQFNAPLGEGALVNRVLPNSPAATAMLQPGDVITKVDGKTVVDSRHLQSVTEHLDPGKSYPVEIIRDGDKINLNVTAGKMPDQLNLTPRPQRVDPPNALNQKPSSFADLGLGVKEVTADQIRQAGYHPEVHGVMIDSVQPNSPAAAAGLQKGMVVERIGKTNVASVQEFNAAEKNISVNNGALLYVQTRQGPKFVSVGSDDL
ncbi:MAG: protease Do [Planctomycetaceae bacterium]|nr:protease Do [Planctomycetaceae bacterium]